MDIGANFGLVLFHAIPFIQRKNATKRGEDEKVKYSTLCDITTFYKPTFHVFSW